MTFEEYEKARRDVETINAKINDANDRGDREEADRLAAEAQQIVQLLQSPEGQRYESVYIQSVIGG